MMTEHVHEWEAGENKRGPIAICKCGEWMQGNEILRRLNATGRFLELQEAARNYIETYAVTICPEKDYDRIQYLRWYDHKK
jgi:hypothetical protein